MLSHTHIGITDFPRALAFYSTLMAELGHVLKFSDADRGWAGWMPVDTARPLFLIGRPYDGAAASPGNGQMVALLAASRETVRRCHAVALAAGGTDEGAPGLRPHYHSDYYGAYFRDPDAISSASAAIITRKRISTERPSTVQTAVKNVAG
ncbi:MAG: VOC family protein [Aliidongia sp.]